MVLTGISWVRVDNFTNHQVIGYWVILMTECIIAIQCLMVSLVFPEVREVSQAINPTRSAT